MHRTALGPKRGRPRAETPRDRLERLEKEIATARAAVREADQRRHAIVGEAVVAEAEASPELKARLAELLARRVTSPQAMAEIATLLMTPRASAAPQGSSAAPEVRELRPATSMPAIGAG